MHCLLDILCRCSVGKGVSYIGDNLTTKVKKRKATRYDADLALSRVAPLTDDGDLWQRAFATADFVIEAVPENLELKHKVIKQAEEVSMLSYVLGILEVFCMYSIAFIVGAHASMSSSRTSCLMFSLRSRRCAIIAFCTTGCRRCCCCCCCH
jgi:3-hydroxyacyl-CoA dehydrogenase, NAD binding domain